MPSYHVRSRRAKTLVVLFGKVMPTWSGRIPEEHSLPRVTSRPGGLHTTPASYKRKTDVTDHEMAVSRHPKPRDALNWQPRPAVYVLRNLISIARGLSTIQGELPRIIAWL